MMNEARPQPQQFQSKITAYLDGSLSPEQKAEFEAFVATHPEVKAQIVKKEEEIAHLKSRIPAMNPSRDQLMSLDSEMKVSVNNLLEDRPDNFLQRVKLTLVDFFNR